MPTIEYDFVLIFVVITKPRKGIKLIKKIVPDQQRKNLIRTLQ